MTSEQFAQLLEILQSINDNLVVCISGLGFGFGSIFFFLVVWLCFVWRGK